MDSKLKLYPKISIVTPSSNQSQFIEDSIKSVLEQHYSNFEHIIIDNSSSDGTIEILKKYEHLKWISEPDRGQSDALNKGFKLATGEIVGWLNADDLFERDIFKVVVEFLNKESWDILFGDFVLVDKQIKPIRHVRPLDFHVPTAIYYGHALPSSGTFFKTKLFREGFHLDLSHKYNMERKLFIELGKAGKKFLYSGTVFSYFRIHENNVSRIGKSERTPAQIKDADKIWERFGIKLFKSDNLNRIIWKILQEVYRLRRYLMRIISMRFSKNLL